MEDIFHEQKTIFWWNWKNCFFFYFVQVVKAKNVSEMNKKKENALNRVLNSIPESQRSEFTKSANSVAFTGFGTRNESNAVKIYEGLTNKKVKILTKYFHDDIFIIEEVQVVGG